MSQQSQAAERRLVLRVLARWQELCGERAFPPRESLAPALLEGDWEHCFCLVLDDPHNPRFDYVGTALAVPGWSWSRQSRVADCPDRTLLKAATGFVPRVLAKRIPICVGDRAMHLERPIMFRAILLPLSDDGERIEALFGAANCREIAAEDG
ncbi:MAG TPA: PAS domain-containing protein [Stellaceae bacterium]|nr:PAS domain-containing protein [Stellaceae bacterium]